MSLHGRAATLIIALAVAFSVEAAGVELSDPVPGFEGMFIPGAWIPLGMTLRSEQQPFRGEIEVTVTASGSTRYRVLQPVRVDEAGSQRVEVVIPAPSPEFTVQARLRPTAGSPEGTEWQIAADRGARRIILVVGREGGLDLLRRIRGTMADDARFVYVTPEEVPIDPLGLDTVDTVVLYDARLSRLTSEAVAALDVWVRRGGRLIALGGVHLSTSDVTVIRLLLPGRVSGLARGMPDDWNRLFPLGIIGDSASILYSRFHPDERARQVPREGIPIIAYEDRGKGSVEFVATDIATLGRIAMPGSGLWREAFPPLSAVGRIRVPTTVTRDPRDTLTGSVLLTDGPRLFPGRGLVALAGLIYVVALAVLTRVLARSHRPPRATVTGPGAAALAVSLLMLLGAARGTWTTPVSVAEGELFRASAVGHGSEPSPGVVEKDLLVASRTGGPVEIGLPAALQPVPRAGHTVTLRQGLGDRQLLVPLARSERRSFYLQSSVALDVTAELSLSSGGAYLSLANNSTRHLHDAYILWNDALFEVGRVARGATVRMELHTGATEAGVARAVGNRRARVLRRVRRGVSRAGPVLVTFFENPLVPVSVPRVYHRRTLSMGLIALQQPASPPAVRR